MKHRTRVLHMKRSCRCYLWWIARRVNQAEVISALYLIFYLRGMLAGIKGKCIPFWLCSCLWSSRVLREVDEGQVCVHQFVQTFLVSAHTKEKRYSGKLSWGINLKFLTVFWCFIDLTFHFSCSTQMFWGYFLFYCEHELVSSLALRCGSSVTSSLV